MYRPMLTLLLLASACKNDSAAPAPAPTATAAHELSPAAPPLPANPHDGTALAASPHGTNPAAAQTAPRPLERLDGGRVALGPFSMTVPEGWAENPSTSSMRAAQFTLPAVGGESPEVVVYYFGQSGAGSVQANIDRWLSQFKQPDDKPSSEVAKIEKAHYAGQDASVVSVSGRYVTGGMPGTAPVDKPDQSLLAAIVPSPQGPFYFRLIGAKAAVAAQEESFRQALDSLKVR
jgi:hypothetical protein